MDPEQKARLRIDQQLELAGWIVQDYREMHITAGRASPFENFRS